jgi:hypothetical protein
MQTALLHIRRTFLFFTPPSGRLLRLFYFPIFLLYCFRLFPIFGFASAGYSRRVQLAALQLPLYLLMTRVIFSKLLRPNNTDDNRLSACVIELGDFPYLLLPPESLYCLLSDFSVYRLPYTTFLRLHENFILSKKGTEFLVTTPGGLSYLTAEGLLAFADVFSYYFQLCPASIENYQAAALLAFPLRREFVTGSLYAELLAEKVPGAQLINAVKAVLSSSNTLYVMLCKGLRARGGSSNMRFEERMLGHEAFMTAAFVSFHTILMITGASADIDSVSMESMLFGKAPEVLGRAKTEIENCKKENDHSFFVDDLKHIDHMVELCLVNATTPLGTFARPVADLKLMSYLSSKRWIMSEKGV